MTRTPSPPVVLVCANRVEDYLGTPGHMVRETYVRALTEISGAVPLLLPAIGDTFDLHDIARRVDGILLTGSFQHLQPARYGGKQLFTDNELDLGRDSTVLPLLDIVIHSDIPVLAICRGMQELNVACGGTLHQYVHDVPGHKDHRHNKEKTMPENYAHRAHLVHTQKGGLFAGWGMGDFHVNSLHEQAVDVVGKGLTVEGISDDGVVEAISHPGHSFAVGVQWHPEGDYKINPASATLFEKFGNAMREAAHGRKRKVINA